MNKAIGAILSLATIGVGAWIASRRSGGSLGGARHRGHNFRGEIEARELQLFCENDGNLYRQQVQPIEKNLTRRIANGTYDHEKSKKLWMYLADNCARKYAKEFGSGQPWHKMFSTADRREVAKNFADSFRDEHRTLHGSR